MRFRRYSRALAVFVAATSVAVATASGSYAQSAYAESNDPSDAALIEAWASAAGIDSGVADVAMMQEQKFAQVADAITEKLGEEAVDLWISRDESSTPIYHARVKSEPDADVASAALRALASSDAQGSIGVQMDSWTVADKTKVLDKIVSGLLSTTQIIQGTYIDVRTGEAVFDIYPATDLKALEEIKQETELSGLRARINPLRDEMSDSASLRGGLKLTDCTTGFAVKSINSSAIGFLTAAHCSNNPSWYPAGSGSGLPSTYYTQNYGAYADIQLNTVGSGNSVVKDVWISGSTYRPVLGTATSYVGSTACKKGKTTGFSCGSINSVTYKPTWSGACPGTTCNSVFVSHAAGTQGGDSGGSTMSYVVGSSPASGYALGIHKGGSTQYSVYSKIGYSPGGWTVNFS